MIYRLTYCNKDGVEARVDIQKGSSTPIIEIEGTERPFILSYNNDKGNKSGMFLSSSADIEIYETTDLDLDLNFNIDNLKTSNETELSVTHYINNVVSWQGFIIPDFFSIEVRNNPVITMTASDRLGTLKNVTLDDLPTMVNIRELTLTCLSKTGLSLPLKTIADFSNDGTVNAFFSYYVDSQRIKDIKGRSINCYDILSSILIASNSKLVQRAGEWVIINKLQHEIGSGKIYSSLSSFTNYLESIYNFEEVSIGARRTIMPVAGSVGIYHEHGGRKSHPANYDFSLDLSGWNSVNGFVATIENRHIIGFLGGTPLFDTERTVKQYLLNYNNWIDDTNNLNTAPYISTDAIPINSPRADRVEVTVDISSTMAEKLSSNTAISFLRYAVILTNGVKTYTLTKAGIFEELDPENVSGHSLLLRGGQQPPLLLASPAFSNSDSFKGLFEVGEDDDVNNYSATIRVYGSGDQYVTVNYALIKFSDVSELPKGTMYKTEQGEVFTKAYDIETSIFGDYLLSGLDGYFYRYPNDDTSSIYKDVNTLSTPVWTTPSIPNETSELPLLHHSMRQMRRMFSVAHDLLSAEIEVNNFDPLAIFVACGIRHTVVSAKFDFFKSNLSVELEEVAFQSATVRDFIYSYFGDGESGIKSIGGISGGGGGGSTGGGLTPEQLEILSFWKKDPENPNTIFTEMNAYSKLELSAYGIGSGGGGGGSDYERLDTWASYDSSKAGWVLSAFLGNDLNTRVTAIDGRVTDLENSAGSGSVTSVGISVPTGLSVSNSPITSSGVIAIDLQTGYSIPTTEKQGQWDTAYSNNHTHSNKTVLDGITSALVSNWNTAFTNSHTHSNKTVLDGITSALVSDWNTAYTNSHTHSNKTQLDLITQSNIDVLARLSIVNGNLQIDGNAYATGELSAYGLGTGGSGGGGIIETVYGYGNLGQTFNNANLTDTFNAYTINQINTRLVSVENGSATTVNTTGTGDLLASVSKVGNNINFIKGNQSWGNLVGKPSVFAPSAHSHPISEITGLQAALNAKENTIAAGTTAQYWRGDKSWQTLNTTIVPEGTNLYYTNARVKAYADTLYSPLGHTHTIAQVTGLQTTLNSKLETSIFNTHNNDNVRHITGAERTKWDGVVTDFEGLEIGGRNLYLNSQTIKSYRKGSDHGNASQWSNIVEDGIEFTRITPINNGNFYFYPQLHNTPFVIKQGESYTVSFEYRHNKEGNVGLYNYLLAPAISRQIPPSESWNKFTATYTVTADKTGSSYLFGFANLVAGQNIDIKNLKLEKGNKATDWTPAFEDQVSDWNTTDVNSFSFIKNKPTLLSQFTDNIGVATHIANKSNPHNVTKAQVGLGNVDNTSDLNKPISTATQTALNLKLDKSIFDDLFEKVEVSTGVFAIKAKYDFYSVGEVSAYGLGSGGSGGGSYDRLDAWADYDSTKSGWVLSALLGNELNTRVGNLEGGSALTVNTTGTGNAITSISKSGSVITASKDLTFSLSNHLHTGVYEPVFSKNTAFNKNFGTASGTVAQGNDSRIINGQTAFGWGNHASAGYALNSAFNTHNTDNVRHITGAERTKWNGVVTDFAELEIGGRNYFRNSRNFTTTSYWNAYTAISSINIVDGNLVIKTNDTHWEPRVYIITTMPTPPLNETAFFYVCIIHKNDEEVAYLDNKIRRGFGDGSEGKTMSRELIEKKVEKTIYSGYVKSTFIYKVTNTIEYLGYINIGVVIPKNSVLTVKEAYMGLGNKPIIDWSPAPEDQVSDWNTTDVNSFSFIKNKPTLLSQFTDNIGVATHIANKANPHSVTKAQVGLGNVDNTADSAKNVLSATKLQTARTIAGVSFDGTANIAIPFANLSSKPTTLGGYGITDAVTLNTAQTISGAKTFSSALTASISVATPKVIFAAAGWSMEQVGSELQMKHNNVLKMRFTSTGSIVATEEITAFG